MGTKAKNICLVLSLVNLITFSITVLFLVCSNLLSPPSPMTSTTLRPKEEITRIINNNLKNLNIISIKKSKYNKQNYLDKQLEKKIILYIEQKKPKLSKKKELYKKIAKNIVANSKFPLITTSIIFLESSYNKQAVNKHSGALGLGQIHPIHVTELKEAGIIDCFNDLKNVEQNIKAIEFVLQQKLEITDGNMNEALKLYSGNACNYNKKIWTEVEKLKQIKNS